MKVKEITEREVRKINDQINYLQDECNWMKRAISNYQDDLGKIEIELERKIKTKEEISKEIKLEITDLESKCIMEKNLLIFLIIILMKQKKLLKN